MAKLFSLLSDAKTMLKSSEVNICVTTIDEEQMTFHMKPKTTGKQLFAQVVKIKGLQEKRFFGLEYVDSRGDLTWLRPHEKITKLDVMKEDPLQFKFRARFFPQDVSKELIQEITQRLFFLEVKAAILNEEMYCPPEKAKLLSSYAIQAQYGEHCREVHKPRYLTQDGLQRVLEQQKHRGISREASMMKYLKIAQGLKMFGIKYFEIKDKEGTELWLGVHCLGLNIYKHKDKLTPNDSFQWKEIKRLFYINTKLTIKLTDKTHMVFYVARSRINKHILAQCKGNFDMCRSNFQAAEKEKERAQKELHVQTRRALELEQEQERMRAKLEKERLEKEHAKKDKERFQAELAEQTQRALELEQEKEKERLEKEHAEEEKERAQAELDLQTRHAFELEQERMRVKEEVEKLEKERFAREQKHQQMLTTLEQKLEHTQKEKERIQAELDEQTPHALELEQERMSTKAEEERLEKERLTTEEAMSGLTKQAVDETKNQEHQAAELSEFVIKIDVVEVAKRRKKECQHKAMSTQEDLGKINIELRIATMNMARPVLSENERAQAELAEQTRRALELEQEQDRIRVKLEKERLEKENAEKDKEKEQTQHALELEQERERLEKENAEKDKEKEQTQHALELEQEMERLEKEHAEKEKERAQAELVEQTQHALELEQEKERLEKEYTEKEKERAQAELDVQTRHSFKMEQERMRVKQEVERLEKLEKERLAREQKHQQILTTLEQKLEHTQKEKEVTQAKLDEQTPHALELEQERMRARAEVERLEKERLATEEAMSGLTKQAVDEKKNQEQQAAELSKFVVKIDIVEEAKRRKEECQHEAMSAQEDQKIKDPDEQDESHTRANVELLNDHNLCLELTQIHDQSKVTQNDVLHAMNPNAGRDRYVMWQIPQGGSVELLNDKEEFAIKAQNVGTQTQLQALSLELAQIHDQSKVTQNDVLHAMNPNAGRDKCVMWQIPQGFTMQRVDQFESMM